MSTQAIAVPATVTKSVPFLSKLGEWFRTKFEPVAKVVVKDATEVAEAAEPIIAIAEPEILPLYNTTLHLVIQAEGVADAAGGGTGSGAQKLASVVSALEPIAIPYLKSIGVSDPTTAQIEAYVNSVVAGMKAFSALTVVPAPAAPEATETAA